MVYVDDILVFSQDEKKIKKFEIFLSEAFDIKNLGNVNYCLGIEFANTRDGIKMNQKGYLNDILERFGMIDAKPVSTPIEPGTKLKRNDDKLIIEKFKNLPYRELVGALMYLAVCTRPDISHAVSYLSQFNSCYDSTHWSAAKRVLRYLKGTENMGLYFKKDQKLLTGYVDADWGNCPEDRRSYTGFVFILGGSPISWESRKQRTVALSSTEAEYMALTEAAKEAVYLRRLLSELGFDKLGHVSLFCDNNGAQKLAKNAIFHNRTKHIDIRYHFIRHILKTEDHFEIEYVSTNDMAADVFTKGLSRCKLHRCLELIGIQDSDE